MSTSRKSTLSFVTLAAPKENAQGAKLLQLRLGRLGIDYLDVSLRLRMRYTDDLTTFTLRPHPHTRCTGVSKFTQGSDKEQIPCASYLGLTKIPHSASPRIKRAVVLATAIKKQGGWS
jgi:hypothetical protein